MNPLFPGLSQAFVQSGSQQQNKKRDKILESNEFNASELCSRKLWQLVNEGDADSAANTELEQAVQELTARRHYLAELARMGKLGDSIHKA